MNSNKINNNTDSKMRSSNTSVNSASNPVMYTPYEKKDRYKYGGYSSTRSNSVINGYFVKEKSYKEIIISRINTALCCILGFFVMVCLISYYFVVQKEIELRKITKATIALNLDNSDMQNTLDNLQSFSNVDFQVSKLNILQRAKKVIELPAADLPSVNYDKAKQDDIVNTYLGY